MASTYSTSLKLELIGNGDQSGVWGTTTNNNLGTLLEQAITGVQAITMSNADYTLSNYNGISDEARNAVLVVSGTNSAVRQIIIPTGQPKLYVVKNTTTGGYAITVGASTGATVTIPNQITAQVYYDGANCYSSQTGSAGDFTVNGTFTATGNESVTGNMTVGGTLGVTGAASLTTGSISGVMTAPTATPGTNTTQIATTAFVTAATSSLGTMASQNANAVAITGGTIDGAVIGATSAANITGTTVVASTQFSGPGTGLTGTAASLTVGTATNATNASNATSGSSLASGTAKAWVSFDGSGTIKKSFNVSSVTRTSTGQYTISFTVAMADANYVTLVTPQTTDNSTIRAIGYVQNGGVSTGSVGVTCHNLGAYLDPTAMYVVVFD